MRRTFSTAALSLALFAAVLPSCGKDEPQPVADDFVLGTEPAFLPPPPTLRRLSQAQYRNAIRDLLGDDIVLPTSLEPDTSTDGLLSNGAAVSAISPLGIEQYEDAAWLLAEQAMGPDLRGALVPCTPSDTVDDGCAEQFVTTFGRRAFRRALTPDEIDAAVDLAAVSAETLGDFYLGLEYALGYLLQSPHFLYRQELGALDADTGTVRYTDHELATRLSFFLWNTTPDAALLEAADAGELSTDSGLQREARRLLDDPRAREGIRTYFDELFTLYTLDALSKDTTIFPHMSAEIGPAAREETLRVIEYIVFDGDEDFRNLLTTQRTFVDRNLAMLYDVPAPVREGFGEVMLDAADGRRGLLGHTSVLAAYAHPVSTSATRRGVFVRTVLLCQNVPPPPADVDTSIPEASGTAVTRRDRVAEHLQNQFCAGCHNITDPIGLGLENFDGLGIWRNLDNGGFIDASGDLDGVPFADAWELAAAVRNHPNFTQCMTNQVMAYAAGHTTQNGERAVAEHLNEKFRLADYSFKDLLFEIVTSDAFRTAAELE